MIKSRKCEQLIYNWFYLFAFLWASDQRNEELPTLLHFAAKYGLKKLTTVLLQCPGALQAYSVMNKNGDYPNTLAEKSGFNDLRQFMDEFVVSPQRKSFQFFAFSRIVLSVWLSFAFKQIQETADLLKSHFEDTINTDESAEVYELMSTNSQDIMMKYSGCSEDIYESMLGINPECAEDFCKYRIILIIVPTIIHTAKLGAADDDGAVLFLSGGGFKMR